MATFRCKRSGNTVSFVNDGDIAGLRKHEGYTEVIDNAETTKTIEAKPQETRTSTGTNENANEGSDEEVLVRRRRGRPPKQGE